MRGWPLISVVITTYKQEKFIGKAIESVLSQGVDDLEVLILDDCSPDATQEVVAKYLDDERVQYVRHSENLGDHGNNALALTKGHGKYLVWLHGDDYLLPGHLRSYLDVMEAHPECALIYSPCYWVDENERILRLARHKGHPGFDYAGGRNEVAELLAWDNYITPSSAMFRQADLDRVGTIDPDTKCYDWDLFIRLAIHNSDFAYLNTPSTAYRICSGQGSNAFYASADPLIAHLHALNTAFESDARGRLWEYKTEIAEHLERRIKSYDSEEVSPYLDSIKTACAQLDSIGMIDLACHLDVQPLVSVIVPTKDRPDLLQDTLRSINNQNYQNWEVVVVNDGGEDVGAMVRALDCHNRFRYVQHKTSRGLPSARNTGIRLSRGDILCYLDDDDTFRPQHLDTVVDALARSGASLVYTEAEYIQERVEGGIRNELGRSQPYSGIGYSKGRLHVANYIPVNTWAHRRELLSQSGLFDVELNAFEDWDLLIRFSRLVDFVHIPEITVDVHMRPSSGHDQMSRRERKDYPSLYRKIYACYSVEGDETLLRRRERQLAALDEEQNQTGQAIGGYQKWVKEHSVTDRDFRHYAKRMVTSWQVQPSFHVIVIHVRGQEEALADTLDSLSSQLYGGWGLSVVSNEPCPDESFTQLEMLEWLQVDGELMPAVNGVVDESVADWMVMVEAGTVFKPNFLYAGVEALHQHPEFNLLYTDEDWIDCEGRRYDPLFKPDFNLELLRSMPYLGDFLLVRRDALMAIGGYSPVLGATAYAMAFRIIERCGAGAIGHIADILIHSQDRFRRAGDDAEVDALCRRVLADHLSRSGIDAVVRDGNLAGTFFVDYAAPVDTPQVEIFIDGDAPAPVLSMTLEHLIAKTDYPALRINLLVTEGCEPSCPEVRHERVRLVPYDTRQGCRLTIETRVKVTDAPYLLFLRLGVIPLQGNWLARLLGPMQRTEVAVTAPRLVSTGNRVIDGGILLGGGGYSVGAVAHSGLALDAPGYMGRAQVAQELGAVTDNCLLIRTDAYRAAGGFSPTIETPLYRAVDLCRRVAAGGGVIVWTPHATLLYVEAAVGEADRLARERTADRESQVVCERWLPELARDSAYNPNLSLRTAHFRVSGDLPSPVIFDSSRPRVLGFGVGSYGSWKYRVEQPLSALHREGLAHRFLIDFPANGVAELPTAAELERLQVDALLFHNAVHDYALDALRLYRRVNHAFVVLGEDDLMTALPPKNPYSKTVYKDIRRRIRRACELADRVVVTTEPLAEALRRYSGDVRVVPNGLPTEIWGSLPRTRRRGGGQPRVGWAGASQHHGDLELLREVVEATATEVDWVFLGMCPDFLQPHVREIHDPVSFDAYPGKLASLGLDLALAPLELNDFNRCKSNLRVLEYGVLGWPVIASDIEPYRDAPVCRVRNQARAWIQAIRDRIHDPDAAWREGDRLREWVRTHGMLEDHLDRWLSVLHPGGGVALTPQVATAGGRAPEAPVAPRPDSVSR